MISNIPAANIKYIKATFKISAKGSRINKFGSENVFDDRNTSP
jgi:hypothetical protein